MQIFFKSIDTHIDNLCESTIRSCGVNYYDVRNAMICTRKSINKPQPVVPLKSRSIHSFIFQKFSMISNQFGISNMAAYGRKAFPNSFSMGITLNSHQCVLGAKLGSCTMYLPSISFDLMIRGKILENWNLW